VNNKDALAKLEKRQRVEFHFGEESKGQYVITQIGASEVILHG
jgi:hypothetical protein